jgi:tRNA (cmo5U34)-methyltransferase
MTMTDQTSAVFSDPEAVTRYAENPPRLVPGFADLQRMTALLLAERLGEEARVLVLGAGGGLELKAFAERRPRWRFVGVDPSSEMLKLAKGTLGSLGTRVELHEGYIDGAPEGPFDGATCLLTLHFVPAAARLRTLSEVYKRLNPGAPFIVAHHSFPQGVDEKALWLSRYAAFAAASGIPIEKAEAAAHEIGRRLPILSPEQDEALMRDAGFSDVSLFYAGFTFRGWIAYRR